MLELYLSRLQKKKKKKGGLMSFKACHIKSIILDNDKNIINISETL